MASVGMQSFIVWCVSIYAGLYCDSHNIIIVIVFVASCDEALSTTTFTEEQLTKIFEDSMTVY